MNHIDRIPGWLKALAASLWVAFVLAPIAAWLVHFHGGTAGWVVLACAIAIHVLILVRTAGENVPDAEYYRRKATPKRRRPSSQDLGFEYGQDNRIDERAKAV